MHRFNGMEIHAWRPIDSQFRLVSAGRNSEPRHPRLGAAIPPAGQRARAGRRWTLISLIVHSVRLAQLTEQQSRRHIIGSWLDR